MQHERIRVCRFLFYFFFLNFIIFYLNVLSLCLSPILYLESSFVWFSLIFYFVLFCFVRSPRKDMNYLLWRVRRSSSRIVLVLVVLDIYVYVYKMKEFETPRVNQRSRFYDTRSSFAIFSSIPSTIFIYFFLLYSLIYLLLLL